MDFGLRPKTKNQKVVKRVIIILFPPVTHNLCLISSSNIHFASVRSSFLLRCPSTHILHYGMQIQGRLYYRIDPLGEGAKWRRSFGQEIFSPLLLAFAEQVNIGGRAKEKLYIIM